MAFAILSALCLLLGLCTILSPKTPVRIFLILACTLPTGHYMKEISTFSGAYFFDFFAAGGLAALFVRTAMGAGSRDASGRSWWRSTLFWTTSAFCLALPYAVTGLGSVDIYFIRDFRPLIFLLQLGVLVALVLNTNAEIITTRFLAWLAVLAGASALIKFGIIWAGGYEQTDVYYQESSYRYLDASAYFCAAFLLYFSCESRSFKGQGALSAAAITLSIAAVLITNSRFILISIIAGMMLVSNISIGRKLSLAALSAFSATAFLAASYYFGIERVVDAFTWEGLIAQVVSRYGPALDRISEMSTWELIFGMGQGTSFDIPWFEYRGLETSAASIDGAYFTYYVKYGIVGAAMLFAYFAAHVPLRASYRYPLGAFLGVMFFVSTTPYQPYAIGLIMAAVCFNAIKHGHHTSPAARKDIDRAA